MAIMLLQLHINCYSVHLISMVVLVTPAHLRPRRLSFQGESFTLYFANLGTKEEYSWLWGVVTNQIIQHRLANLTVLEDLTIKAKKNVHFKQHFPWIN